MALRDDAERAERAGRQFRQIVAGDVLDDFAAALGQRAVGQRQRHADDQVAQRAEAKTQRAAVVGGKNAADGGAARPQRVEGKALSDVARVSRELLHGAASFDGDGEIGPGMFDDRVETRGRENDVGALRRIAPSELCSAAARNHGQSRHRSRVSALSPALAHCPARPRVAAARRQRHLRRWLLAHVQAETMARAASSNAAMFCIDREETPASIVRSAPRFPRSRADAARICRVFRRTGAGVGKPWWDSRAAADRTRSARAASFRGPAR